MSHSLSSAIESHHQCLGVIASQDGKPPLETPQTSADRSSVHAAATALRGHLIFSLRTVSITLGPSHILLTLFNQGISSQHPDLFTPCISASSLGEAQYNDRGSGDYSAALTLFAQRTKAFSESGHLTRLIHLRRLDDVDVISTLWSTSLKPSQAIAPFSRRGSPLLATSYAPISARLLPPASVPTSRTFMAPSAAEFSSATACKSSRSSPCSSTSAGCSRRPGTALQPHRCQQQQCPLRERRSQHGPQRY